MKDKNEQLAEIQPQVPQTKYRDLFDLINEKLNSRRAKLGALKSIAQSIQYSLINTAEYMVRVEQRQEATGGTDGVPTLDERNSLDEWTRGDEMASAIGAEFGFTAPVPPEERIQRASRLYYGVIGLILAFRPNEYERPRGIVATLSEYVPRLGAASEADELLLKELELEPGEFEAAREQARLRKAEKMQNVRPRILQLLEDHADTNPMLEAWDELPAQVQLRMGCNAYKGVYYARKNLVSYLATNSKAIRENAGEVKLMQADLKTIEDWCLQFESEHRDVFDLLIEAGMTVYTVEDAKADLKDQQARRNSK